MFLINTASDCQMAKIGLWIFSTGLVCLALVGGICCCLQVHAISHNLWPRKPLTRTNQNIPQVKHS
jgi:hypothetical protein